MRASHDIQAEANKIMTQIGALRVQHEQAERPLLERMTELDAEMRKAQEMESPAGIARRLEALEGKKADK